MFKSLRILTPDMSPGDIKEIFNRAFGGYAIKTVRRKPDTTTVSIDQENEQDKEFWKEFYDTLQKLGRVYIESHPVTDEFTHAHIKFREEPMDGHWEVRIAKNTKVTDFNSRVEPKCTCACTCGAGR